MTNKERIRRMTDEELGQFLKAVSRNYMIQFYDIVKWLSAEKKDPVYMGYDGVYLKGAADYTNSIVSKKNEGEPENLRVPCRIVEKKKCFGQEYRRIIVNGELMDVQAEYVEDESEF